MRLSCLAVAWIASCPFILSANAGAGESPDVVVADFEGTDYNGWTPTGTAFGDGPARGALPHQMDVTGYLGKGLVNSFHGGDDATGRLKSKVFKVERPYLNFLIGGGKYPGETCVNLLVDGSVRRTATGPNDRPGGSERLDWTSWDVREFLGKDGAIEIVDDRKGGWGHINVDQIVQSDTARGTEPASREMTITSRYLYIPVQFGSPLRRVKASVDGATVREFETSLAEGAPDFRAFDDVSALKGKRITIESVLPAGSRALSAIEQADDLPDAAGLYKEALRPNFHFTSRRGWLNDPNGLVWKDGRYHLFYQHNPYGWDWGNMHWGHAVSPDLVHWEEQSEALRPREFGDWCFSGSAVVDHANSSGFRTKNQPPLVAAFTSTGRGECIVFSLDDGRTWTEYGKNPVVKHSGRDPRLLWHAPSKKWVMAVYDELDRKQWIAFYSSTDLKTWKYESRIDGFFECPDLFELKVRGGPSRSYWVLSAADGKYLLGSFDGHEFIPDSPEKKQLWHGNFYAAQTYSDAPDGRRIQIGWAHGITFPGMPFNQQMTIPAELSLRKTKDGVRLFAQPVAEVASLRGKREGKRDFLLNPGSPLELPVADTGADIEFKAALEPNSGVALKFGPLLLTYDAASETLRCGESRAPVPLIEGTLTLRILVDRRSLEVFAADGSACFSAPLTAPEPLRGFSTSATHAAVRIIDVSAYSMRSTRR